MWINVINAKLPAREKSTSDNFSRTVQMYHMGGQQTGNVSIAAVAVFVRNGFQRHIICSYTAIGDDAVV